MISRGIFSSLLFVLLFLCMLPSSTSADVRYVFLINLHKGNISTEVLELQKYLNTHGFTLAASGPGSSGQETTKFAALTYGALVKFQDAHAEDILAPLGLKKGTGILGSSTRAYINRVDAVAGTSSSSSSAVVCNAPQASPACRAPL